MCGSGPTGRSSGLLEEIGREKGVDPGAIEVWFADEARVGQKNKITRRWAKRGRAPTRRKIREPPRPSLRRDLPQRRQRRGAHNAAVRPRGDEPAPGRDRHADRAGGSAALCLVGNSGRPGPLSPRRWRRAHGFVRDTSRIEALGLPTICAEPMRRTKVLVERQLTSGRLSIEGIRVATGDQIFGDCEGVLIVPAEVENEAVAAARAKASTGK